MKVVELYKFEVTAGGVDTTYRWTSAALDVQWNGETWEQTQIGRGAPKIKPETKDPKLDLRCAPDNPVALLYRSQPPDKTVRVTIYRGDLDDLAGTVQGFWVGNLVKVHFGHGAATLKCAPDLSSVRRPMPTARYSRVCRWALYSEPCGVDPSFKLGVEGEIVDLVVGTTSNYVEVKLSSQLAEDAARRGRLVTAGIIQTIIRSDEGTDNGDGTWNHRLYVESIKAVYTIGDTAQVRAGFTESGLIESVDSATRQVTVQLDTLIEEGWLQGGMLTVAGEQRVIVAQAAGTDNGDGTWSHVLVVGRWSSELVATASVSVRAGCAHTQGDCLDKFDNIHSYGGFTKLPESTQNPWEGR